MGVVERSLRLLETQQAGLGVWLAVLLVLAAFVAVLLGRPETLFGNRLGAAPRVALVLAVGVIGAISVVNISYVAWYRHRCVDHRSDTPECVVGTTAPTPSSVFP
jgi:hypothetical protein